MQSRHNIKNKNPVKKISRISIFYFGTRELLIKSPTVICSAIQHFMRFVADCKSSKRRRKLYTSLTRINISSNSVIRYSGLCKLYQLHRICLFALLLLLNFSNKKFSHYRSCRYAFGYSLLFFEEGTVGLPRKRHWNFR